jgi:hypothetical protein
VQYVNSKGGRYNWPVPAPPTVRIWRDASQTHYSARRGVFRFTVVAVDLLTGRIVTMFMLGTPFQASYSMPAAVARMLSGDLLNACDQVGQGIPTVGHLPN